MRPNDLAVARTDKRENRIGRATQPPPYAPRAAGPWRRLAIALAASILAVAIALPLATRLDPVIGDLLLFRFADVSATKRDDIVIVTLTEDTLAQFPYRSPIDRGFLADLIDTLAAAGPKAIGLDILLDSPSDPDKDRKLFEAIDRASSPVILAVAKGAKLLTDRQYAYLQEVVANRKHGSVILQRDDTDGILRHLPSPFDRDGKPVLTFTGALADTGSGRKPVSGRILYHPPEQDGAPAFPRYPAQTVAFLPPDWFAGKYVLIGTDLPNIDRHPTPLVSIAGSAAGTLPGIVIHAHILAQVLSGRMIATLSLTQTLLLMAAAALAVALIFARTRRPGRFALFLGAAIAIYAFGVWLLVSRDIVMPPVLGPPAAALACAFILAVVRWRADRTERAFLKTAFSRYVSPAVVKRLSSGDISLALGGQKRTVTYLFTDLQGFTTLSESLPPDQVAELLNGYLDRMCDLMTEHGATIDKIIGDAVVGFFGAPEAMSDQSARAVNLAMALDAACEDYRADAVRRGIPLGATRIGVHRGEAVIGNFGGRRFFDYTGIGDTVNTAARLEGANRYLGTRICVSRDVAEDCDSVAFRPVGDIVLKGRAAPLSCYEPMPAENTAAAWMKGYLEAFRQMENGDRDALAAFEKVAKLNPEDGPTRLHLKRLREGAEGAKVVFSEK
ncbi:adenylate/guanylate cyclase domain-containing protein [Roseibium aggregatum]|uniref:Adenylate/guanylate cyclase domain-containing protein n=1 Tax=Roseibium aggregatum TaxID=187304 RepID=A0A926P1K4_9HYPH|nr:adenylate/guanylate cyclase domain-containing protein [Roseibium aggregatum]MBD1548311.1 adenylate/guanylate cyclase domain-containing protein [Roseibium aggregatum]